jgi:hypothetical protein
MANRIKQSNLSVEEMADLYRQGKSSTRIAELAGLSRVSVLKALRRLGVTIRPPTTPRRFDHARIVADYVGGMTYSQVARKHSAQVSTTRKIIIGSGVTLRPVFESRLRGPSHPMWGGGVRPNTDGYPETKEGRLHRFEMREMIGRDPEAWEAVHHVDGDKSNLERDNLVLMPEREHSRFHLFLRHRGLSIGRQNMDAVCREEPGCVRRFTRKDYLLACQRYPLPDGRSASHAPIRRCTAGNCQEKHYGRGLCAMHYQRCRAKERGCWISGGGRDL